VIHCGRTMTKPLLEQLPKIVVNGKAHAGRIRAGLR
jgi:hypothetical protein